MADLAKLSPDFWRGRRVLLTGHTGFKGAWLTMWLHRLGARVTAVSLPPQTSPNLFSLADIGAIGVSHFCDIRDATALAALVQAAQPEIVFHLAAQALVRTGYDDPLGTFATNVQGTANVLDALRAIDSVRAIVAVTTDKVYQNREQIFPYRETDELGGRDPYSASKAAAELLIASYRQSYLGPKGVALASARAGNVIGGGDWSADRLIPDAVRAWQVGQPLVVRNPQAIRPWQHVLESLAAYITLAQQLWDRPELAGAYNFGPQADAASTVDCVIKLARDAYGSGVICYENSSETFHEAGFLSLEVSKARVVLGVRPKWTLVQAITRTMAWYRAVGEGADALSLCEADLAAYQGLP